MKQFNLEEYLANPESKVVTRLGEEVEIISTRGRKPFRIIGYVDDNQSPLHWCSNGHFLTDGKSSMYDLFIADEDNEDERIRKDIIAFLQSMNSHCDPAQDWDLRNRWLPYLEKQKEQKPAEWSEKDDALLKEIVSFFKDGTVKLQHDLNLYAGFLQNKFKSLRPRPHWKPSEEQMEALNALNCHGYLSYVGQQNKLISLYNDLKRLKGGVAPMRDIDE